MPAAAQLRLALAKAEWERAFILLNGRPARTLDSANLDAQTAPQLQMPPPASHQRHAPRELGMFRASEYRRSFVQSEASFERKLVELANFRYPHQQSRSQLSSSQYSAYGLEYASSSRNSSMYSADAFAAVAGSRSQASLNSLADPSLAASAYAADFGGTSPRPGVSITQRKRVSRLPSARSRNVSQHSCQTASVSPAVALSRLPNALPAAPSGLGRMCISNTTQSSSMSLAAPSEIAETTEADLAAGSVVQTGSQLAGDSGSEAFLSGSATPPLHDGFSSVDTAHRDAQLANSGSALMLKSILSPSLLGLTSHALEDAISPSCSKPAGGSKGRSRGTNGSRRRTAARSGAMLVVATDVAAVPASLPPISNPVEGEFELIAVQPERLARSTTQAILELEHSMQTAAMAVGDKAAARTPMYEFPAVKPYSGSSPTAKSPMRKRLWRWGRTGASNTGKAAVDQAVASAGSSTGSVTASQSSTMDRLPSFFNFASLSLSSSLSSGSTPTSSLLVETAGSGSFGIPGDSDASPSDSFNSGVPSPRSAPASPVSPVSPVSPGSPGSSESFRPPGSAWSVPENGLEAYAKGDSTVASAHFPEYAQLSRTSRGPQMPSQTALAGAHVRLQQRRCATVASHLPEHLQRHLNQRAKHRAQATSLSYSLDGTRRFDARRGTTGNGSTAGGSDAGPRRAMTPGGVIETRTVYSKQSKEQPWVNPLRGGVEVSQGRINQYVILRTIGAGSFGNVVLVQSELDNRYYACKIMSKSRLRKKFRWDDLDRSQQVFSQRQRQQQQPGEGMASSDSTLLSRSRTGPAASSGSVARALWDMEREVAILKKISEHPNINALIEVLDDTLEDHLYLIFELCEYGPVMRLQPFGVVRPFSEDLARGYFRDAVLGLEYLHYKHIIHCDIKPENLLLTAEGRVQIADFGISVMFDEMDDEPIVAARHASPLFAPPEMHDPAQTHVKGRAMDVWSLGVTLYCFVHGRCPFEEASPITLSRRVQSAPLDFDAKLSGDLVDLLTRMLNRSPNSRIALPEIKQHPWVTRHGSDPLMSTAENCVFEDVTDEEVAHALRPASSILSKLLRMLSRRPRSGSATPTL